MNNEQSATVIENHLQMVVLKPVREQSGRCLKIMSEGEYLIGSAEHCDFQLPFDGIADEHCRLKYDGNRAVVHAIDSRIWVNDGPANGISLRKKDRLSIGPINFIFDFSQVEQQPSPTGAFSPDEDSLFSDDQLIQALQRAVSQGRIDPRAVAQLFPETDSSDSPASEKVLDELNQAIRQSQRQQAEHQQELNQLQEKSAEKIDQLQQQLTEQLTLSQQHEANLSEKQSEIEKLTARFEEQIEQLNAREQQLQNELQATRELENQWEQREKTYLAEQEQLEQKLKSLEEKLSVALEQIEKEENSELEQQIQQERESWEEKQKQFELELREKEEEQAELEQNLAVARQEAAAAREQVAELEKQITPLEEQISEIRNKLQETEELVQQEQERIKELQDQLQHVAEAEQEKLREQVAVREQAEKERDDAIEQLSQLREKESCELETAQIKLEEKDAEIESLQQQLKQLEEQQQENNEQKLKNAAEQEMIEAAKEELEAEKEAFSQARQDIQELREEVEQQQQQLQQQLESLEAERAALIQEQEQNPEQSFAASAEEEAMEKTILESHYSEQEASIESPENDNLDQTESEEEVKFEETAQAVTEAETSSIDEQSEPNRVEFDLDVDELSAMLENKEETNEETETAPLSTCESAVEEPAADEDEMSSGELNNDENTPETDDTPDKDDILNLRGELAKMFGLDQAENTSEVSPQTEQAVEDVVEGEKQEPCSVVAQEPLSEATETTPVEPATETAPVAEEASEQSGVEDSVVDAEDPDSISAYMKALFERTSGKQEYNETSFSSRAEKPEKEEECSQENPAVIRGDISENIEVEAVPQEPPAPIAEVDHESVAMEIASLRDVANQTARSALCAHAWKQLRVKVLVNGILTVAGGVASAVLLTAPIWGNQSYVGYGVITLLLSTVSAIELIRANMMVNRLKAGISSAGEQSTEEDCGCE